jgi:hypothetical protein
VSGRLEEIRELGVAWCTEAQFEKLLAVAEAAEELLDCLSIEIDDERLGYVVAKIRRRDLDGLRAALAGLGGDNPE